MMRSIVLSLATFPLILLFPSCDSPQVQMPQPPVWIREIPFEGKTKLGGCTLGDFNPEIPGPEIAVVTGSGEVFVLSHIGDEWKKETAAVLPGEMIQCAAGDIVPDHPGDELVAVGAKKGGEDDGGPGAAWVLWREEDGQWSHELLTEDPLLLHAVCIGDLVASQPGNEVLVAGYSRTAHIFARNDSGGGWSSIGKADVQGEAKGAALLGTGAVIANADGTVVQIEEAGVEWVTSRLARFPKPQARIATSGDDVLVCSNDGGLRLIRGSESKLIYHSRDRLRGAVFLDMDPGRDGIEIATAGYDGTITLLYPAGESWTPHTVGSDSDRFHHLTGGVFPRIGPALVGCGYSGRVVLIRAADKNPTDE